MTKLNLTGKDPDNGQYKRLGPGDGLRNVNNYLFATGFQGFTGLIGATGLSTGQQGATGIGETGFQGWTGLRGIRGNTGTGASTGATGLRGLTGIALEGSAGLPGATGSEGVTGLQGTTGLRGHTGPFGTTGLAVIGSTGVQGITGIGIQGQTGIQGATGTQGATGSQGDTGISVTGLQGITGAAIQGATGLVRYRTLDFQQQTTGVTLLTTIAANTLSADRQTVDFNIWGRLADATTVVEITYGSSVITSEPIAIIDEDIGITGSILRTNSLSQVVSLQLMGTSIALIENQNTSQDITAPQNLAISFSSAGTGHVLYAILAAKTP